MCLQMRGFGRKRPMVGVTMVIFLLSLTGLPPLFGFFGKVYLFTAVVEAGFVWLAVIGILNSVLALGVYLRIIVAMYQTGVDVDESVKKSLPPELIVAIGIVALVTFGMGLLAGFLPGWCSKL